MRTSIARSSSLPAERGGRRPGARTLAHGYNPRVRGTCQRGAWAVMLGVVVFGEAADLWVVAGGTLIVGAVCFISWREAVLKRQAVTPPVSATKV